ncbi:MAG: hypothetical protein IKS45_11070 [Thermoguttaceae bacterium]|nr:hypothetical protein [Thermoguttaceae bacterium]
MNAPQFAFRFIPALIAAVISLFSSAVANEPLSPMELCKETFYSSSGQMSASELYDFWESFDSDSDREKYLNSWAKSETFCQKAVLIKLFYYPVFRYNYPELFKQRQCIIQIINELKRKAQFDITDFYILNQLCHLEPDVLKPELLSLTRKIGNIPTVWEYKKSQFELKLLFEHSVLTDQYFSEFFGYDWIESPCLPSWLGELHCISALGSDVSDDVIAREIRKLEELYSNLKKNYDLWTAARANELGQENEAVWNEYCHVYDGISLILSYLRYSGKRSSQALPILYSMLDFDYQKSVEKPPRETLLDKSDLGLTIISINPDDPKAIVRAFPFCLEDNYRQLTESDFPLDNFPDCLPVSDYRGELLNNKLFCRVLERLRKDNKISFSEYLEYFCYSRITSEQYAEIIQQVKAILKKEPQSISPFAIGDFLMSQRQKTEVKSDLIEILEYYWDNNISTPDNVIKTMEIPSSENEYPDLIMVDLCIRTCLFVFTPEQTVDYIVSRLDKKNAALLLSRFAMQIQSGVCEYDSAPIAFNKKRTIQLFQNRLKEYPENASGYILFKGFVERLNRSQNEMER